MIAADLASREASGKPVRVALVPLNPWVESVDGLPRRSRGRPGTGEALGAVEYRRGGGDSGSRET